VANEQLERLYKSHIERTKMAVTKSWKEPNTLGPPVLQSWMDASHGSHWVM